MDRVREFLEQLKQSGCAQGNLLGLLNLVIGRTIVRADGGPVSSGLTWRETARWLKKVRWKKEAARELGIEPANLPPRDRVRYWYQAISQAEIDSPRAVRAGDDLARRMAKLGYRTGTGPRTG
jgi:hypothetical protein